MTPPSERVAKVDTTPRDPDIERLLHGRLHEPRRVLGLHRVRDDADEAVVRVLRAERDARPAARARRRARRAFPARRCSNGQGRAAASRRPIGFAGSRRTAVGTKATIRTRFRSRSTTATSRRFAAGSHIHAHRFLGAHARTIAGVRGIRFAVWAPNAERVSVVGTFNHWDGRYHPMSVRGSSGVWELFVPELGAGELYKYEIYTRDSRELKLKADPYGAAFEKRPATASITTPPSTFAGTTRRGSSSARGATGSRSRSRSTRCTWARGGATPPAIS